MIYIILQSCKKAEHAQKLEETFVLIMCTLLPRYPKSSDCLELLPIALTGIEVANIIWPKATSSRPNKYVSGRCIAAILQLYGPSQVDPLILLACEATLRKQGMASFSFHVRLSWRAIPISSNSI